MYIMYMTYFDTFTYRVLSSFAHGLNPYRLLSGICTNYVPNYVPNEYILPLYMYWLEVHVGATHSGT